MRRCIPTFIKCVHKLAVLERFSFSRFPMLKRVVRENERRSIISQLMLNRSNSMTNSMSLDSDGFVDGVGGFILDDSAHRNVRGNIGPIATERWRVRVRQRNIQWHRRDDNAVDQPKLRGFSRCCDDIGAAALFHRQLQHQLAQTRILGRTRRFHALHFHVDLRHSAGLHLRFLFPRPLKTQGIFFALYSFSLLAMPLYPDRWTWLNSSIASSYDYQSLIIKYEIEAYLLLNIMYALVFFYIAYL